MMHNKIKLAYVSAAFNADNINKNISTDRLLCLLKANDDYYLEAVYSNDSYNDKFQDEKIVITNSMFAQFNKSERDMIKVGLLPMDTDWIITYVHNFDGVHTALTQKLLYNKTWITFMCDLAPCDSFRILGLEMEKPYGMKETEMILKYSDSVIFLDCYQKRYLLDKYKINDCDRFSIVPFEIKRSDLSDVVKKPEKVFRYLGQLYGDRNLLEFIEAFCEWVAENDSSNYVLEIYGNVEDWIKEKINLFSCNKIKIMSEVSYEESLELMKGADFLVGSDANVVKNLGYFPFSTSKIFNYLSFRRPIIYIAMEKSANRDLLERVGGIVCSFDKKDIVGGLNKIIKYEIKFDEEEILKLAPAVIGEQINKVILNTKRIYLAEDDFLVDYKKAIFDTMSVMLYENDQLSRELISKKEKIIDQQEKINNLRLKKRLGLL